MRRTLLPFVACLVLAACGTRPAALAPAHQADFAACQSDATAAARVDSMRKRLEFIDDCMFKRGWRPTPACTETDMRGTAFCDYRR